MYSQSKLSYTIAMILGASCTGIVRGEVRSSDSESTTDSIQEITVTAERRAENLQDVPITVQALTAETISQMNVVNFDEFVRLLPNVSQATSGPGQSSIFIRGLNTDANDGPGGGATGAMPGVAIYLDEQSGQLPSRNLDVYVADLERIEVLEGPQGTLFGGGALNGVLRYITNKPKLDITEGSVDAGYGLTAHGDPNSNATAVINLPVIPDTLAVRAVIYDDQKGGYINNVPGTFTRSSTDLGLARYNNGVVPTNSLSISNNNLVGNAINPVTYTGIRVGALYKFNDDWNALLTQSYQDMNSLGVFNAMPYGVEGARLTSNALPIGGEPLPPLSVQAFNPSYDKDKFENTALVVDGKIADLKLIYSGSYMVRNVNSQQDYTNYARGVYASYYQCTGLSSTSAAAGQCYSPSAVYKETEKNTHQSHELRLSTPEDKRIRGLIGAYWEDYKILDQTQWTYVSVPTCSPTGLTSNCFLPIQPWPGSPSFTPNPESGFFDDVERSYKQMAEFASVDIDLIPHTLTLSGGIRHFKFDYSELGGDVGSAGCLQTTTTTYFGPCQTPGGTNLSVTSPNRATPSGNRARGNLSWHVTDDALLYYTWSQGFRAGAFNRGTSCHLPGPDGVNQYCTPAFTVPDNITNNEVGWKTEWFDRRLQFDGSVYQENWNNAQTNFFDPQGGLGNLSFSVNGPNYRVRGFEPSIVARVTSGLTFQTSASWNSASQTNSPYLIDNNPQSVNYGKAITSIPDPYGPIGSPTPYSPPFKVGARVRYEWAIYDYQAFLQVNGDHQAHMVTGTGYRPAYDIPGFSTYGASGGLARGPWTAQLFAQNLTNSSASVDKDAGQFILVNVPLRPRVLGLRVSYKFADK